MHTSSVKDPTHYSLQDHAAQSLLLLTYDFDKTWAAFVLHTFEKAHIASTIHIIFAWLIPAMPYIFLLWLIIIASAFAPIEETQPPKNLILHKVANQKCWLDLGNTVYRGFLQSVMFLGLDLLNLRGNQTW